MDDSSRRVWRPNTNRGIPGRPQNYDVPVRGRQRSTVNRLETTGLWRNTSSENRSDLNQARFKPSDRRNSIDSRDDRLGTRGLDQFEGRSTPGMERTNSVGNVNQSLNTQSWMTAANQSQGEGWTPAKRRKGQWKGPDSPNSREQGPAHKNALNHDKYYRGVQNRGGQRRYETPITQLNSLNDWNQLSTLNSPLRIMLKLQELESSWVASFHSNASLEVMDVAFDLFCQFDGKWKYERLALMKSLFTPSFCERLRQLLEECKKSWFLCGKDKVVAYVEHIRLNTEFILTNDLSFHVKESTEAQILSSLIQECISLLTFIGSKLHDMTGGGDPTIEQEILKIEELSTIKYVESFELDKPVYPVDFRSAPDALMPNVVFGPFQNDHHYMETHFGLLKEDFESNLREGVEQYLHDSKQRNHKIWAYQDVVVQRLISRADNSTEPDKLLYRISFPECKYLSKIQWEYAKRFMFGSLVVLTSNGFETYYLAIVEDQHFKNPSEISIAVRPISSFPKGLERFKFLLVEPKVFYEPYFQSLKVLKQMARVGVPLKKYLVNADATPRLPSYINKDTSYNIGSCDIKVCDVLAWPNAEVLGLNLSQREAFINSLTREMTLIQGPPGTGKTFLALKIVETLLLNRTNTDSFKNGPIMIVCYKNHSLDQILEGLLKKHVSIVRIGSRSKVPEIQERCLARRLPNPPGMLNLDKEKTSLTSKLSSIMEEIKDIVETVKLIKSRIGIVRIEFLSQFIGNSFLDQELTQWLLAPLRDVPLSCTPLEDIISCHGRLYSSKLESLFEINLHEIGNDTLKLHSKLIGMVEASEYDIINSKFWSCYNWYELLAYGLNLDVDSTDCPNPRSVGFPGYNHLEPDERWALYNTWEQKFISALENKLALLQNQVPGLTENLLEFNEMILGLKLKYRQPDVIGATTSGAAKHYSALADVGAKVVLVEEAAEVLEAHVIAALSNKCEHLIMIGDHQQLRPTTASFKLDKLYGMSTSLFERMINNKVAWSSLSTQHRMRPEIAALICPSIYTNLQNSPSVGQYPDVLGTNKNVFFFDHNHPEQIGTDSESKFNTEEADMLLAICSYLIKQGYSSESITILSTYLAQDRYISQRIKQRNEYGKLNHTVVDNYQGEENTIILLSLVRSNQLGEVGFLSTKNRVCVALSRAKHGLFMFGNMSCLKMKEMSSIWRDVNEILIGQESISTKFPLKCVKHSNITEVISPQDVNALTNGGCNNPCMTLLPCEHTCRLMCHALDQDHISEFQCMERCIRRCPNGHNCSAQCKVSCPPCQVPMQKRLVCGHSVQLRCTQPNSQSYCIETVEIQLDTCSHNQMVLCRETMKPELIICQALCLKENTCGHICKRKCHINSDPDHTSTHLCSESCELINKSCPRKHKCNKKCSEPCGDCLVDVERNLPCNHKIMVPCSQDLTNFICEQNCLKKLPCGHDCVNSCYEKCGRCLVKVPKVIEACGHTVTVRCSEEPSLRDCKGRCKTIKSCGHQCSGLCKDDCGKQFCEVLEEMELPCGHKLSDTCGNLEKYRHDYASECKTACLALLPCGHKCAGTCGKCLQNRIHVPCTRNCKKPLVCSHKCGHSCHDAYHSCTQEDCLGKCWRNEINNRSFYKLIRSGKGKKKRTTSVFNPLNKLILDLKHALIQKCQSMPYTDLPSNALVAKMLDQMRTSVVSTFRRTHSDDSKELCLLKTSMFVTEFVTVSRAVFSRLADSKMSSVKKTELERLSEKLVHRVNTRRENMGTFVIQQLQEQMVWVSLNIYAHEIDDTKGDVGALHQLLEEGKYSFGVNERCAVFQLLQDLKADPAMPMGTDPCDVMFPDTARWCQPIYHHLLSEKSKVEKDTAPVVTKHESDATMEDANGEKPRVDCVIDLTGEELLVDGSAKDSSNVPNIPPANESVGETLIQPTANTSENYGAGAQQEGTGGLQQSAFLKSVNRLDTQTQVSHSTSSDTTPQVPKQLAFMQWLSGNAGDHEPPPSTAQKAMEDGNEERRWVSYSAINRTGGSAKDTPVVSSNLPAKHQSRRNPLIQPSARNTAGRSQERSSSSAFSNWSSSNSLSAARASNARTRTRTLASRTRWNQKFREDNESYLNDID